MKLKGEAVTVLFEGVFIVLITGLLFYVFVSVQLDAPEPVVNDIPLVETDHGLFSVVKQTVEIDDLLAYNDALYSYMKKSLGGNVSATYSYGHYMSPSMYFDTDFQSFLDGLPLAGYGVETLDEHRGYLAVEVIYDKETRTPTSQSINFHFCCEFSDSAYIEIVDVINQYLGIEADYEEVQNSVSQLTLGSSIVNADGLRFEIKPDSIGKNGEFEHIYVSMFYRDNV